MIFGKAQLADAQRFIAPQRVVRRPSLRSTSPRLWAAVATPCRRVEHRPHDCVGLFEQRPRFEIFVNAAESQTSLYSATARRMFLDDPVVRRDELIACIASPRSKAPYLFVRDALAGWSPRCALTTFWPAAVESTSAVVSRSPERSRVSMRNSASPRCVAIARPARRAAGCERIAFLDSIGCRRPARNRAMLRPGAGRAQYRHARRRRSAAARAQADSQHTPALSTCTCWSNPASESLINCLARAASPESGTDAGFDSDGPLSRHRRRCSACPARCDP